MSLCARPIDPLDAQAIAAGAEPIFASDAAEHARECAACGEEVSRALRLGKSLEWNAGEAGEAVESVTTDLADRIVRLRPFSRRERRDFTLWRGACGLCVAVFCGGLLLLTLPGLTVREQAGLGIAAVAPLAIFWKALAQAAVQTVMATPGGLKALSEALRQQQTLGLAALALLAPILLALRRALAKARR